MPFGLSNTLASFQGYINKILAENLDIFVIVYLYDILIYTEGSGQPHMEVVRKILEQPYKHRLFANLKKFCFYQDKIGCLRFVVSIQGIEINKEKMEVIKTWPEKKSVWDSKVFLGFANLY